ncbi:radical SAM family heme chaperone HemW [Helicobacter cappadocius]|uniref:Heme chaperone HemW n=1 Tax=Helicobacter cappadocius TaxID=3063998 RepID=A0AA90Q3T7_9HELI|nr:MULTISPECIES: radical SAM family heme chaperone HemW [unclassified Helicobacter]MDO7253674.1 radical SAM family heme chaperone HemW [Helicobacter sp. faydin-H75]MDP2539638.1 radical SAM family heme chaperone HemW [Helicobacter sp. faydin-H76]
MILYIHIPFCTSKCGYCTFNSYAKEDHLKLEYMKALQKDIIDSLKQNTETIDSIFFGGGTPNSIESKFYGNIFEAIWKYSKISKDCEITTEANPELITQQWCRDMQSFGVNRMSVGVQSFFDDKLLFLQREHNYEDIHKCIDLIYQSNIKNISIDLIYDTPQDNKNRIFEEIRNASKLPINHISAYSLSIEKDSKLAQIYEKNPQTNSFFEEIREALSEYGFHIYEVSNYSRGYKVKHNLAYWRGEEYIGCGAGAVGRKGYIRYYSQRNIEKYIKNTSKKDIEHLSKNDLDNEAIFLGLRSEVGVSLDILKDKQEKIKILIEEKKCHLIEENYNKQKIQKLVANDFFIADEIALWLM